jgi:hypothetical protein
MKNRALFVLISGLSLLVGHGFAQFNYLSFDVHCDSTANANACPAGLAPGATARSTVFEGITPGGDIVGNYSDTVGKSHGFLLTGFLQSGGTAGQLTNIDVPVSVLGLSGSGTLPTSANGINPAGDIVGSFTAPVNATTTNPDAYCPAAGSAACNKGFLYRHGRYSVVLFPGHPGATPQRITPDGDIYGCLHDFDLMTSMFGASWSRLGNTSLLADGGQRSDGMATPMSMTNGATSGGDVIVGWFNDMDMAGNPRRGFVIRNGAFQAYDAAPGNILTALWDINPGQQFVGTYIASNGIRHGLLQNPDSPSSINVDPPGAAATIAFGINPAGVIVGQYTAAGKTHSYVAIPTGTN